MSTLLMVSALIYNVSSLRNHIHKTKSTSKDTYVFIIIYIKISMMRRAGASKFLCYSSITNQPYFCDIAFKIWHRLSNLFNLHVTQKVNICIRWWCSHLKILQCCPRNEMCKLMQQKNRLETSINCCQLHSETTLMMFSQKRNLAFKLNQCGL